MGSADVRRENLAWLLERGFRVAASLPIGLGEDTELRPVAEISGRLIALGALCRWVAGSEERSPALKVRAQTDQVLEHFTEEEREILALERAAAREEHLDHIGWRMENMWPLAWILGFDREPGLDGEMIHGETLDELFAFLPKVDEAPGDFLRRTQPRASEAVIRLEDRFYCCHNAVRSAQLGSPSVPDGFHPVTNGGVIHERRHALTWSLSPGERWDDTDLST